MDNFKDIGRLIKDPEISELTETQKCTFKIAINRPYKNKETDEYDADFVTCEAIGDKAKLIFGGFRKGHRILISGRLKIDSWKDSEDNWKNMTKINVSSFAYVERKNYEASEQGKTVEYNKEVKKEQPIEPTIVDPFANNGIVSKEPFRVEPTIEVDPDELPF